MEGVVVSNHQATDRVRLRLRAQRAPPARGGSPARWAPVWIAAVAIALLWPGLAVAQVEQPLDVASAVEKSVERYVQAQRVAARQRLLSGQLEALRAAGRSSAADGDLTAGLKAADPQTRQAVAAVLGASAGVVEQDLQQAAAALDGRILEAASAWRGVRTAVYEGRATLSQLGAHAAPQTGLASLLSLEDRWFWIAVIAALAVLFGAAMHARRHAFRRWASGRRGKVLVRLAFAAGFAVLVLAVAGLGVADRLADATRADGARGSAATYQDLQAESARLEAEIQKATSALQDSEKQRAELQEAAQRRWAGALEGAGNAPVLSQSLRDRALDVAERLAVLEELPGAIQADLDELAKLQEQLAATAEAGARHQSLRLGIRRGVGCATLAVVVAGAWLMQRRSRRRRVAQANTCPLCLGAIRGSTSQNGQAAGSQIVRCENVLDRAKGVRCNYAIRDAYRAMLKLCFPTLGVARAGKTHWLAMLYWQLNQGNFPSSVRFERVRSADPGGGEDFDRMVEQILISRLGTTATQPERIPHPLVFNFRDRDRWGTSSVLVNIFDYSGEVTATLGLDDYRRRRAMEADGYFFFLDPTLPAEPQAKALAEFREDLRLVKGVGANRALRLPLALCVSKIDLLAGQAYALPDGRDAVAKFYDDLARIDPTGEAMTLEVIEARSELLARLRDTVWPGWQIERSIAELFGGRYAFFPLTPVGLDGQGEKDLNLRTIAPFGLLEPLVWLLHMNGYPILE